LRQLLAAGRSQAECAGELGVSIRTIGTGGSPDARPGV
jgi:DNA-binding CsgD family transcriptional regulator